MTEQNARHEVRQDNGYWFPAKRYGWGWGVPLCWQGWAVMGAYLLILLVAGAALAANGHMAAFHGIVLLATGALIGICWLKGEPPGWRWGDD